MAATALLPQTACLEAATDAEATSSRSQVRHRDWLQDQDPFLRAAELLNKIFFLGAISPDIKFMWSAEDERLEDRYLDFCSSWTDRKGCSVGHKIFMHPINTLVRMQTTLV
ncbi:hypothetical protein EK21DRAFT_109435 [Setomelanomma holmii]|uniref:Uncharacterized protein n=1 Tax=Setomelanomma holmii TaxID=210430 RepID=A0A9P4HDV8_9PLEO|nr:hypothetical protein EK21DRAFT_109435 [Setomelanomma holmii]